jgi:hypothetical protein
MKLEGFANLSSGRSRARGARFGSTWFTGTMSLIGALADWHEEDCLNGEKEMAAYPSWPGKPR